MANFPHNYIEHEDPYGVEAEYTHAPDLSKPVDAERVAARMRELLDSTRAPLPPATAPYRLPDGRIVMINEDVARGALLVSFTLVGGRVVDAVRVGPTRWPL